MVRGVTWAAPRAWGMPAATASQASALRVETTTLAGSFASNSAEERPMPRLEPVMTATLPVRSNGVDFILNFSVIGAVILRCERLYVASLEGWEDGASVPSRTRALRGRRWRDGTSG